MRIWLKVGALSPSLRNQLREQGYTLTASEASVLQRSLDAINLLSIGLLTESERRRVVQRFMKRVGKVARRKT